MSNGEDMFLGICAECGRDIIGDEKKVLICQDELYGEYWVHAGECFEKYNKLLTSPEAVEQGMILGMCNICCRPVRQEQRYLIDGIGRVLDPCVEEDIPFNTTFPSSKGKFSIVFEHKECRENFRNLT